MPEHDSDYDGAWKEALREHLPHFIEKYFPAMHAAIDWTAPLEWLDKEVSQVLGQAHRRNREVDVLVKVRLRSGKEQWILVHLEIQTAFEEGFEIRLARHTVRHDSEWVKRIRTSKDSWSGIAERFWSRSEARGRRRSWKDRRGSVTKLRAKSAGEAAHSESCRAV